MISNNREHSSFTPAETAMVLVDHQPAVLRMVGSGQLAEGVAADAFTS